jgi:hypothetical protein
LIDAVSNILNTVLNRITKSQKGKGGGTIAHKQLIETVASMLNTVPSGII